MKTDRLREILAAHPIPKRFYHLRKSAKNLEVWCGSLTLESQRRTFEIERVNCMDCIDAHADRKQPPSPEFYNCCGADKQSGHANSCSKSLKSCVHGISLRVVCETCVKDIHGY